MSSVRLARLGELEVASSCVPGQHFEKHSHDEFVIGANLVGEERIWLDGRSFSAGVGAITTYNPGEIQGGGARAKGNRGAMSACTCPRHGWPRASAAASCSSSARCSRHRPWPASWPERSKPA